MDFLDQFLLSPSPNPHPTPAEHPGYFLTKGEMGTVVVSEQEVEERSRKNAEMYREMRGLDPMGTEGYRGRRSVSATREGEAGTSPGPSVVVGSPPKDGGMQAANEAAKGL
jgi:hypothetical protein